jgi:hypothetical protein
MLIEEASDVSPLFELGTPKVHFSTSHYWANERLSIQNLWRVVINESDITPSVILIVQSQIERSILEMLSIWWSNTLSLRRTNNESWSFSKRSKVAESIILIIDV